MERIPNRIIKINKHVKYRWDISDALVGLKFRSMESGWVYILKFRDGLYKIGHSTSLLSRLRSLWQQQKDMYIVCLIETDDPVRLELVMQLYFYYKWEWCKYSCETFRLEESDIQRIYDGAFDDFECVHSVQKRLKEIREGPHAEYLLHW